MEPITHIIEWFDGTQLVGSQPITAGDFTDAQYQAERINERATDNTFTYRVVCAACMDVCRNIHDCQALR